MTPNFTLSLSFEGIRLLHRVPGGWHLVGEVALDAADLSGELAALRTAALDLAGGKMHTKLLIPAAQIKFTTIETAQTSLADVHAALDGATPYAIEDLVIDFDRNGGRTHIAAVARETLAEAESFAKDHGYNPVAFVAIAEPLTFQHEVFFGPAQGYEGTPAMRDDNPVKVIGRSPLVQSDATEQPEPVDMPEPEAATSVEADAAPQVVDAADAPPTAPVDLPDFSAPETVPVMPSETEPQGAPDVVFASRGRAKSMAPPTFSKMEKSIPPPPSEPEDDPEPEIEPLFTRRKEPPALAVPVGASHGPAVIAPTIDIPDVPIRPIVADAPPPADAPSLTGKPAAAAKTDVPLSPVHVVAPHQPVKEPQSKTVFDQRKPVRRKPRFLALKLTAALVLFLFLIALWANTWSDEGIAGWFAADPDTRAAESEPAAAQETEIVAAPVAPAPEFAETTAPSALVPDTDITPDEAVAAPLPVVRAPTGRVLSPAEADRIYAATGVYQRAPRLPLIPRENSLDGFRESKIVVAADVPDRLNMPTQEAMFPDLSLESPRNPPPAGTRYQRDLRGFILATADGVLTPDGALVFAGEPLVRPPLRPGTEIVAAPDPSPVAANGEGLILVAGPPPIVPPLRPEDLVPAEPEATTTEVTDAPSPTAEAPAVDDVIVVSGIAIRVPQIVPDAPAEQVELDSDVSTTGAEDTQTTALPEALNLIAGRPTLTPPLRPENVSTAVIEAALNEAIVAPDSGEVVVLSGAPDIRPPLRPAAFAALIEATNAVVVVNPDIVTANGVQLASLRPNLRRSKNAPAAEPDVFSDPALAGLRPSLRPDGLAPATEVAAAPAADISSVVAAIAGAAPPSAFVNVTPRAVRVSERPDLRPRNFARVVAAAQARSQTRAASTVAAAQPAAAVRSAPVQPTGPIPGGVARAATVDNAIRLRDINLIGVYGRPGDRRALVRMGNGRYVKVEVGSSLDGGRVSAIGDSALNYVKRGKTYALQLPNS